jgi:hypothetical protein
MDLTEGSETSANIKQTLGKHPKGNTVNTEHSESLKSRITHRLEDNIKKGYKNIKRAQIRLNWFAFMKGMRFVGQMRDC